MGARLDAHCGLRGSRRDACNRLELICPGMEFARHAPMAPGVRLSVGSFGIGS